MKDGVVEQRNCRRYSNRTSNPYVEALLKWTEKKYYYG
jgi:hypothetical protein